MSPEEFYQSQVSDHNRGRTPVKPMAETPKEKLVNFLLSDEYLTLLERAVASRYWTSTNNKAKHEKAMNLIRLYKQDA